MRSTTQAFLLAAILLVSLAVTAQTESVLYSFCPQVSGCTDGVDPAGGLVADSAGNFYGVTYDGGASGYGVVFELSAAGTETILHTFAGYPSDGASPWGALIMDKSGNLYGTTEYGGAYGSGVVFELSPNGTETILHSFAGAPSDGNAPLGPLLMDANGNLYGTTYAGGSYVTGYGVVFELSSDGTETILHSFGTVTNDGLNPSGNLVMDSSGNLYGTTRGGGSDGAGAVYKLAPGGTQTILHSFNVLNGDGVTPEAGLLMDKKGNLYGTTFYGGLFSHGTLFLVRPNGTETVLHRFGYKNDGKFPQSTLIMDAKGNLYGTTAAGGSSLSSGTVFEYSPSGTETILVNFDRTNGLQPQASLFMDKKGNLYGVTSLGGASNKGTVFEVTP